MITWWDGAVRDGTSVPFDLTDRGLTLGDGLFETMVAVAGVIDQAGAHLDRMTAGAATLGIPVDRDAIAAAAQALADRAGPAGGIIRLTLTRGPGQRGLVPPAEPRPVLFGALSAYRPELAFAPVRLATATPRRNDRSPTSGLKTLGYLDAILGLREAIDAGADDALFLDTTGHVACTSVANVAVVKDRRLATPALAHGVLPGTQRARLLRLAARAGLEPVETALTPADLLAADAVLLTNSVRLLCPVTALDGTPLAPAPQLVSDLAGLLLADMPAPPPSLRA
jgi:branched-chain amino acid aminotransferase